jgi:hypothetical protein
MSFTYQDSTDGLGGDTMYGRRISLVHDMWSSIASDSYLAFTLCYIGSIDGKMSLEFKKMMVPVTSGHTADETRENLRYR